MKLYKDIVVDLCKPYPLVVMHVPQYNTAWGARVTLVADGQIIVPDKETINAYIKKPDGEVVYASCTLSGEKILVSFDEQATAVPGPSEVELQLISNGDNLTSPIYQMVVDKSNIDYAMLTSTSEFGALLDALDTVNGLNVIDPANATASDIGMPADAYYTGQALENHETRIAANETAISQQNEKIDIRVIKNVKLVFSTVTVAKTVNELGDYYGTINLATDTSVQLPEGVIAIIPLGGATRIDEPGYVGAVAPYKWQSAYLANKQWGVVAPTAGTYGVVFACLY